MQGLGFIGFGFGVHRVWVWGLRFRGFRGRVRV